MGLTSELIEKKKGAYKASLLADSVDGQFHSVSFGIVTKDDIPLDMTVSLTPYGLEHDYNGEDKDKVDEIVNLLGTKLAEKVGITFNEKPQFESIEPENIKPEQAESESIDSSEVGSVEDVLGDIINTQNEEV